MNRRAFLASAGVLGVAWWFTGHDREQDGESFYFDPPEDRPYIYAYSAAPRKTSYTAGSPITVRFYVANYGGEAGQFKRRIRVRGQRDSGTKMVEGGVEIDTTVKRRVGAKTKAEIDAVLSAPEETGQFVVNAGAVRPAPDVAETSRTVIEVVPPSAEESKKIEGD